MLKTKNNTSLNRNQSTSMSKTGERNGEKDGKALYKLMSNAVYGKAIENLRNRIDVKLVSYKKKLFQMDIQTKLYVTQNIWL